MKSKKKTYTEKDLKNIAELIQNDLICLLSDESYDTTVKACQIVVDRIKEVRDGE